MKCTTFQWPLPTRSLLIRPRAPCPWERVAALASPSLCLSPSWRLLGFEKSPLLTPQSQNTIPFSGAGDWGLSQARPGACFCLTPMVSCCLRTGLWYKVEYHRRTNKGFELPQMGAQILPCHSAGFKQSLGLSGHHFPHF